jgi:hypothetical protein
MQNREIYLTLIDWLINWCLTLIVAVFQLYRGVSLIDVLVY